MEQKWKWKWELGMWGCCFNLSPTTQDVTGHGRPPEEERNFGLLPQTAADAAAWGCEAQSRFKRTLSHRNWTLYSQFHIWGRISFLLKAAILHNLGTHEVPPGELSVAQREDNSLKNMIKFNLLKSDSPPPAGGSGRWRLARLDGVSATNWQSSWFGSERRLWFISPQSQCKWRAAPCILLSAHTELNGGQQELNKVRKHKVRGREREREWAAILNLGCTWRRLYCLTKLYFGAIFFGSVFLAPTV